MWTDWASDPMGSNRPRSSTLLAASKGLGLSQGGMTTVKRRSKSRHPSRHFFHKSINCFSISKWEKNSKNKWSKRLQSFWVEKSPTKPKFWNPIQNHQQTILKPPKNSNKSQVQRKVQQNRLVLNVGNFREWSQSSLSIIILQCAAPKRYKLVYNPI